MLIGILIAVPVTAIAVVVGLNFVPSERQVERRIEHRYGATDPQFLRTMGVLLGPAILPGNRVQYLENGDEIFPAMLAAIAVGTRNDHVRDLYLLVGRDRQNASPTR